MEQKSHLYRCLCHFVCVLNCFSRVWLFATLQTVTHQPPLSMEFSRQEYWSYISSSLKQRCFWDSPGSPAVKTPRSHCRGCWFHPWFGELRSFMSHRQKKKKKKKKDASNYFSQLCGQNPVHGTSNKGSKEGVPYLEKFSNWTRQHHQKHVHTNMFGLCALSKNC